MFGPEVFDPGFLDVASEMGMLEKGLSHHPTQHGLEKGTRGCSEADVG